MSPFGRVTRLLNGPRVGPVTLCHACGLPIVAERRTCCPSHPWCPHTCPHPCKETRR